MRCFFAIVFLIITIVTFGQRKLEGVYSTNSNFVGSVFKFSNDSLFEFNTYSCTNHSNSNGFFKRKKRILLINFIDIGINRNAVKIIEKDSSQHDSVTFNFEVISIMDSSSSFETIPFVNISLIDSLGESFNTICDINGTSKIKLHSQNVVVPISASYLGYSTFNFKTNAVKSKVIQIQLKERSGGIPGGTVWKFKIKKWNSKKLVLYDYERKWTTTFYKIQ